MYCKNCGTEISDNSSYCPHCGTAVEKEDNTFNNENKNGQSKSGMGVLLCILLGLIGLIIGICIYPSGSVARKTFVKAWVITYVVEVLIGFALGIIMTMAGADLFDGYVSYYYY